MAILDHSEWGGPPHLGPRFSKLLSLYAALSPSWPRDLVRTIVWWAHTGIMSLGLFAWGRFWQHTCAHTCDSPLSHQNPEKCVLNQNTNPRSSKLYSQPGYTSGARAHPMYCGVLGCDFCQGMNFPLSLPTCTAYYLISDSKQEHFHRHAA